MRLYKKRKILAVRPCLTDTIDSRNFFFGSKSAIHVFTGFHETGINALGGNNLLWFFHIQGGKAQFYPDSAARYNPFGNSIRPAQSHSGIGHVAAFEHIANHGTRNPDGLAGRKFNFYRFDYAYFEALPSDQ